MSSADCTITPLVLTHTLLWSHLPWRESSAFAAAIVTHSNSAFSLEAAITVR